MEPQRLSEDRFDALIGNVLRAGVLLSVVIVLVGAGIVLARHGGDIPDYTVFHGEPNDLRSLAGITGSALTGGGRAIVQLGLLVLISTPVARVTLSVVAFAVQRDRTFVLITLIVLVNLSFGLFAVIP